MGVLAKRNAVAQLVVVVQEIIRLWGEGSYRVDGNPKLHETRHLKLDCRKSRTHLGWRPQYAIQDALSLTVQWYRAFYTGVAPQDLGNLAVSQIGSYMNGEREDQETPG